MASRQQSPRKVRIVGGALAAVWLAAGVAAVAVAGLTSRWVLLVPGLFALWYGLVWSRVARQGRLLRGRELWAPWRAKKQSDV